MVRADALDLAGLAEVAEALDVSRRTARRYAARDEFPAAIANLATGPVWRRREVIDWGREHLPLPKGRPQSGER